MNLQMNFMLLPPKVAIVDDDVELIDDLKQCMDENINITGFTSVDSLLKILPYQYENFYKLLNEFFSLILQKNFNLSEIETKFHELISNRPISVGLIDLNFGEKYIFEGFEFNELLRQYPIRSLIYSGLKADELSIDFINEGLISGYICKTSDLFEDLIPAIYMQNRIFYSMYFNISHLLMIKNASFTECCENITKLNNLTDKDSFIVYDKNINYLHNK